ncbi:MAG: FxsA family protein [Thermodesulfobacteriota bacterium]|nr:FxsA family protein [Thermodesulfobacteriota bacterium]
MLPKLILAFTPSFGTLAIVTLTSRGLVARMEGIRTAMRVRENLRRGELPAEEMLDAVLIFMPGMVLLTPGFVTAWAGVAILVPKTREVFKRSLRKKFDGWIANNKAKIVTF